MLFAQSHIYNIYYPINCVGVSCSCLAEFMSYRCNVLHYCQLKYVKPVFMQSISVYVHVYILHCTRLSAVDCIPTLYLAVNVNVSSFQSLLTHFSICVHVYPTVIRFIECNWRQPVWSVCYINWISVCGN